MTNMNVLVAKPKLVTFATVLVAISSPEGLSFRNDFFIGQIH